MKIPFTKAHGAHNDFLITWRERIPEDVDVAVMARAICERHTGIGADGWLLLSPSREADVAIELWNSDGSKSELSGNGTRCVAAYLLENARAGTDVQIATAAGLKHLRLIHRDGLKFLFEMNMGRAIVQELHTQIEGRDATILNVGNPQCAVFVDNFDFDWRAVGARIEYDERFQNRTNVSFVHVLGESELSVRFWERGAGETMSSGTGSTGAGAAALARALVKSPVEVKTPAGPLSLRWENGEILLTGPAEITASGDFNY